MRSARFLGTAAFYGGVAVLHRLSPLITAPLITAAFSVISCGVLDTLHTVLALVGVVIGLNVTNGVYRLYYEKPIEERKQLLGSTLICYLGSALLLAIVISLCSRLVSTWLFKERSYYFLVLLTALRFPFLLAFEQYGATLRILQRPKIFAFFNVAFLGCNVLIVTGLHLSSSLTVERLTLLQTLVQVGFTALMGWSLRRAYSLKFNRRLVGEVLRYSLPQLPQVLIDAIMYGGMPLLITQFASLHDTGLYGVGVKVASAFGMMVFAFNLAFDPMIMRLVAKGKETFVAVLRAALDFYSLLLWPALLFVYLVPYLFPLFIDAKFTQSLAIIPPIVLTRFLLGLSNIFGKGIAYYKRTKYFSYAQGFAALVFASLAYPLITGYGFVGAAYLLMLSVLVQSVATYLLSSRLLRVRYAMQPFLVHVGLVTALSLIRVPLIQGFIVAFGLIFCLWSLFRSRFLTLTRSIA